MRRPRHYLLLVLLWVFWCSDSPADAALWEQHMRAATTARQSGQHEDALRQVQRSLKEAEAFGEQDPALRHATLRPREDLPRSGALWGGRPLYQRALTVRDKALAHEHPEVSATLTDLPEPCPASRPKQKGAAIATRIQAMPIHCQSMLRLEGICV